jgi:hypothetical protein
MNTCRLSPPAIGLALALAMLVPLAAEPAGPDDGMSGLAVNALVKAYEYVRLGPDEDAPFRLDSYVVVITQYGSGFSIGFGRHDAGDLRSVFIDGRSNTIATPKLDWPYQGTTLLPGVIAGEIVAAYRHALSDTGLSPETKARLANAAYDLEYGPRPTTLSLLFVAANPPFPTVLLRNEPTATPSPGWTCLAGACRGQLAYYLVTIRGDHLNIESRGIP